MLLNRLSTLTFLPPATSGVTGASSAADEAQPAVGSGLGASDVVAKRVRPSALDKPEVEPAADPAPKGVLLHLDSSRKTASSGTYTKEGLFSDLPRATPLTPAEEFVAAAVVNLRNYDQAKVNAANDAASKNGGNGNTAQQGRFDSIKQAVSKLYSAA